MLNLGILGFASPWLLTALVTLPAIWWLLRLIPPAPQRIAFPPFMIVRQIKEPEETPDRSPWWLLLLRLVIAALLILALAGPLLNPQARVGGSGPVTIILDDGWGAAAGFERRIATMEAIVEQARRDNRPIRLIRSAPDENGISIELFDAERLAEAIPGIEPRPWPADHGATLTAIEEIDELGGVVWLRNALVDDVAATVALAGRLQERGELSIIGDDREGNLPWLNIPQLSTLGFDITLQRSRDDTPWQGSVVASGPGGETLARQPIAIEEGALDVQATIALPRELRNETARITLEPRLHGAQQVLLDERWRRRTVGLWGGAAGDDAQPLLNELYFVRKAALPFAEIIEGPLLELLDKPMSLLVLADHGDFDDAEAVALGQWIEAGGVLLRFAGPRLASSQGQMVPVPLRGGERELGGAMSWSEPLRIASFNPDGPFAGLDVADDVLIRRQVLAEPSPDLPEATLAVLEDGTPLITGARRGEGWIILVHTTANAEWSNLALSGVFVDLVRRAIETGPGAGGVTRGLLKPSMLLDAHGELEAPEAMTRSIDAQELGNSMAGPDVPPGLYAPVVAESATGQELPRQAFNIQQGLDLIEAFPRIEGVATQPFRAGKEIDLGHWLLMAALVLLLADLIIAMLLRGIAGTGRTAAAAAGRTAASIIALALAGGIAQAQEFDVERAIELTEQTRLGYVVTGIPELDQNSEAGLSGLIRTLAARTSIEAGPPVAVDIDSDPIELFPLLYWPVTADHPDIDDETRRRIAAYLRGGGMVIFDTLDAAVLFPGEDGGGPGEQRLAQLMDGMDLAPLEPVPQDHVLTRSFYLLQDFPGRWTGQTVWVDRTSINVNDGVSGIIIGAHDWASAWALDGSGRPLYPVVPGGERQREMAWRFGINLVMYAMTGNYKTDQVHIPALLERLGE